LGQGRGWAGEDEGKGEGKGKEGKWRGGKGRAPKLLLNQGPSEPCYATGWRSGVCECTYISMIKRKPLIRSNDLKLATVVVLDILSKRVDLGSKGQGQGHGVIIPIFRFWDLLSSQYL